MSTCNNGYFPKDGVCASCESPCKTCGNSTTQCITCDQTTPTPLFFNYTCISTASCASTLGYYINSLNSSCNACPVNCGSCVSNINCTSCASNFYLFQGSCLSSCLPNTYKSNQ